MSEPVSPNTMSFKARFSAVRSWVARLSARHLIGIGLLSASGLLLLVAKAPSAVRDVALLSKVRSELRAAFAPSAAAVPAPPTLDRADYDRRLRALAHVPEVIAIPEADGPVPVSIGFVFGAGTGAGVTAGADEGAGVGVTSGADEGAGVGAGAGPDANAVGVPLAAPASSKVPALSLWPVTDAPYPLPGAILPFKRIVAYYGNFSATSMGVLGEYPEDVMLGKLHDEIDKWEAADPSTPVLPAVDYIAIPAQGDAGRDGKYRVRMSDTQLDRAVAVAAKVDGIVILEVQAGLSDVMTEVRSLEPYLIKPQVHLAIDPEFAMAPSGARPGTKVGTVDAKDINAAAQYLAGLVRDHGLPPKVLIVHRYTGPMLTNALKIAPLPEVQVVIDMDGWGPPAKKYGTYKSHVASEPVQFTGFKLFYKNDIRQPGTALLTPQEVLRLTPSPVFIQYQ